MEFQSTSSSRGYLSSNSSNNSIPRLGSPLLPGGILPLGVSAVARINAPDVSLGTANWVSAQSESSIFLKARETLGLLDRACQKTDKLCQKMKRRSWLQINETQCREFLQLNSLTVALSHFLEELKNETPEVQATCWAAAREMYKVIFVTEEFVEECSGPVIPVRALRKVGNGTDFSLIRFQLIWCVRVLKLVLSQAKRESNPDLGSDLNDKVAHSLSEDNNVELEAYCIEDRKALLKKLQENSGSLKLKRLGSKPKDPERRILQFLCSLNNEDGMQGSPCNVGTPQGSPEEGSNSMLGQLVSTKCVFVNPTEFKWEQRPSIGSGSFGTVQSATWLGEKVAVKIVRASIHACASFDAFMREVNHQAGLRHPHILPLFGYSFDENKGECYIVMELAQGNLRNYITNQRCNLTLELAVDIMLQISEGMKYLHSKDLIHRDLKAENVLVNWKGIAGLSDIQYVQAKLCDFGLARTKFDGSNSIGKTPNAGTKFWIAPEVLQEITSIDDSTIGVNYSVEADVYSFAMTFYEVLTGKIPFEGITISWKNFRIKVLNGDRPELPRDCPKYLACFIKRCWDGIPNRRPPFDDICKMLRHFKVLLLRIGERPPTDSNIFSVFTAADLEAIRCHLGMEWCINAISEGMIFKEVLLSWIMVEKYRLNAKDEGKYDEVLLMAAEHFANFSGLEHDFSRAFSFIHDAAERGYAEAQWKVGLFLELGLGVKIDEKEAVEWYKRAKKQKHPCALVDLGRCYYLGRGVEKSLHKASKCCRQAYVYSEGKTLHCIQDLLIILNHAEDPWYSELAAKRLFELTFEDGRPLITGPNSQNIQDLVSALGANSMSKFGRHEMLKDAVETLGLLFDGAGTEAIYFSVQSGLISVLDECLRYNAPCFVDVLICCLQGNVSKLWLRRNSEVVSSLMSIHSRAPGVSNEKALQIRQRLEEFGFKECECKTFN
eukprot:Gb_35658 [translate_table: standard]